MAVITSKSPGAPFEILREGAVIGLSGDLLLADAAAIWREVQSATNGTDAITLDFSKVNRVDGSVMALLVELRAKLVERGASADFTGANSQVETIAQLYAEHMDVPKEPPYQPEGAVRQIGRVTYDLKEEAKAFLDFLGCTVRACAAVIRKPRTGHWKALAPLCERAGADAVPIVLLINFLIGFVIAFQSAKQLESFGANVYVADLVEISLTRELGPFMTAIIVCGRSGAAFAAEIGSMKVNEEIDALRTLGISPYVWLTIPRIIALALVVPLLTLIADFIGSAGGLFVGTNILGLTVQGYISETLKAVHGWDIVTGLIKSSVFSVAIGLIACQQGFAATGGPEGVGKRTTASVVASLFILVMIDAIFTVVFRRLGI